MTIQRDEMQVALLKELGLENLPVSAQQEALAIMGGPIIQAVTIAIMLKIPQEHHEAFETAVTSGDSDALERIITTHIPDSTAFIEEETKKAIAEFKSLMEE